MAPDGARLAVVVGAYGSDGRVLVMDVTGDNVTAVTHGAVSTASVAWSPDGQLLAYDLGQTARTPCHLAATRVRGRAGLVSGRSQHRVRRTAVDRPTPRRREAR